MMEESSSSQSSSDGDGQPYTLVRESSSASSENTSANNSSPSSTENKVPACTSDWTRGLIDKLALRYDGTKLPSDIAAEHMAPIAAFLPHEPAILQKVATNLGAIGFLRNPQSFLEVDVDTVRRLASMSDDLALLRGSVPTNFREELDM
jgi:hypothetical protein